MCYNVMDNERKNKLKGDKIWNQISKNMVCSY